MAMMTVDLRNYRDTRGARVPEGEYLVAVDDIEEGETRNKDTKYTVFFRIVGGEYDGLTIVETLTQTPAAMFRTANFLQGMGLKIKREKLQINFSRFIGKRVKVAVSDAEPFGGTIRSQIDSYLGTVATSSAEDDLDSLAEQAEEEPERPTKAARPEDTIDDAEVDLDDVEL